MTSQAGDLDMLINANREDIEGFVLTPRERVLAVLKKQKVDKIVWQPRLDLWYNVNKRLGTLPERFRNMSLIEMYDDLLAVPRSYLFYESCFRSLEGANVQLTVREDEEHIYRQYETPKGEIKETIAKTVHGVADSLRTDNFVKNVEDLETLQYVLERQTWEFDRERYQKAKELLGERVQSCAQVGYAPLQAFLILYNSLQRGLIMLWKYKQKVEELMQTIQENNERKIKVLRESPMDVVVFDDNIHHDICSPPHFKKYILPYYQKETKTLHEAGKFCISHWDGDVALLLPYVKETGLDGLECVTPKPQGDVTVEEIREALEGKVLFDGIPSNHFMPWTSVDEVAEFTRHILDVFGTNIVLGISDNMPPSPEAQIDKVRIVGEIVDKYTPNHDGPAR